jgi:hypothetical protein
MHDCTQEDPDAATIIVYLPDFIIPVLLIKIKINKFIV